MNDFFNIVNDIVTLKKEEQMALAKAIRIRHLEMGDAWIKEGASAHQLAFISEGYLRKYYRHETREITDGFYFDNTFATDLPGILARKPALCNLVAMEPTELFLLSYDSLSALASKYPSIEHLLRVVIAQDFVAFYYRHMVLRLIPPPQRYAQLLQDRPLVLQRAEPYHIASFLGITAQQLARVRAKRM